MELGERSARRNPALRGCPVARWCRARAHGLTDEIPAPRRKRAPVRMQHRRRDSARSARPHAARARSRRARRRAFLAHVAIPRRRSRAQPQSGTSRASAHNARHHADALDLEALPAARHGVTFRNITLLPFLARVARLPKLARTRILAARRISAHLPVSSATRKIAAALRIVRSSSAIRAVPRIAQSAQSAVTHARSHASARC